MDNAKKLVWDQTELDLEGTELTKMTAVIQDLINTYGSNAYIDNDYISHGGGYKLVLKFQREETDAELKARLNREDQIENMRKNAEQKEREEYERLKKKFEENKD